MKPDQSAGAKATITPISTLTTSLQSSGGFSQAIPPKAMNANTRETIDIQTTKCGLALYWAALVISGAAVLLAGSLFFFRHGPLMIVVVNAMAAVSNVMIWMASGMRSRS